jgi:hypothetical protein
MSLVLLDAYLDASGKHSNVKDKLITVNGCLSTGTSWDAFDKDWQAALKDLGFKPDPKSGKYVFHTTDFHSGYCKLSPPGLSKVNRQSVYRELIPIVRKHSLYLVGFAIALKHYERFRNDYPNITKYRLGKPGTFVSVMTAGRLREWALNNGYSPSISIMFDQGDEFWGEMSQGFRTFAKHPLGRDLRLGSLMSGDKAEYSPLQAADIVAWECRQYFSSLVNVTLEIKGIKKRPELEMLRWPQSLFSLYKYHDLKRRVLELFPSASSITEVENVLTDIANGHEAKLRKKRERRNERKRKQDEGSASE